MCKRSREVEADKYLNYIEQGTEGGTKPDISLLEKVEDYFVAKDAGKEPSTEAKDAFAKRQERYLGWIADGGWLGPFVDFNDSSNVRKVAKEDLERSKVFLEWGTAVIG